MKAVAVKNFPRADVHTANALGEAGVSIVHEAQGRIGLLHPVIRSVYAAIHQTGGRVEAKPGKALVFMLGGVRRSR